MCPMDGRKVCISEFTGRNIGLSQGEQVKQVQESLYTRKTAFVSLTVSRRNWERQREKRSIGEKFDEKGEEILLSVGISGILLLSRRYQPLCLCNIVCG